MIFLVSGKEKNGSINFKLAIFEPIDGIHTTERLAFTIPEIKNILTH